MTDLSRRALLKGAGLAGAAGALPAVATAQQAPAPTPYRFFNADEAAFVEAAIDRLIPPDDTWPGAREAGVATYIDGQLAGAHGGGDRLYLQGPWKQGTPEQGYQLGLTPADLYRTALQAIFANLAGQGADFTGLEPGRQDDFLKQLESGALDLNGVNSAIFFETLLANTIEGFFADPSYGGNRDKVGWRMVGFPGLYAAYLPLYTHHGMAFDLEPIGMSDTSVGRSHDHGR